MSKAHLRIAAFVCAGLAVSTFSGCKTPEAAQVEQSEVQNTGSGRRIVPNFYNLRSRLSWLQSTTYKDIDDVPTKASPGCELITFVNELPTDSGDVGHSGIAIGREFYDYGPKNGYSKVEIDLDWTRISTPMATAEGSPWWDTTARGYGETKMWDPAKYKNSDDIDLLAILDNLDGIASNQTILFISMEVPQDHAARIKRWWKKLYADFPQYNIPGMHCTSSVIRSFEETETADESLWQRVRGGDIWTPDTMSPTMWTAKLLDDQALSWNSLLKYQHRCGPNEGQIIRAAMVRVGDDLKELGGEDMLMPIAELRARLDAGLRKRQAN